MGNCRGCVHVLGDKLVYRKGEDVQMFRCGYAEQEFGGERWVADLEGCEVFKSVIPEEGTIEFLRTCGGCGGGGKFNGTFTSYYCTACSGTGKVEMFPNDND
ncbi:hypothetical protein [Bacillus paranthracis]|uniref:hypothetical protein n=1 Tax=Bacillus paranthracis TaxID=2026186 RepID=UPI0013D1796C|nr:hypothetical protein [Bacillus paranthracis]